MYNVHIQYITSNKYIFIQNDTLEIKEYHNLKKENATYNHHRKIPKIVLVDLTNGQRRGGDHWRPTGVFVILTFGDFLKRRYAVSLPIIS